MRSILKLYAAEPHLFNIARRSGRSTLSILLRKDFKCRFDFNAHVAGLGGAPIFHSRKPSALIDIGRDFKCRIARSHQLPIPRLARKAMPLQLERRGQRIDASVEHLHHIIVGAIDHDFTGPDRASRFDPYTGIGCDDPGTAHISKAFLHPLHNPRSIVAPLILIIAPEKIGGCCPVFVLNRVEKILCVTSYLARRPPEPNEI